MATPISKNQYGDDVYQTPNGQKTGTQITQELASANWDGKGDPVAVYNQTASGNSSSQTQQQQQPAQASGAALGAAIDKLLGARAAGDKAAFDEAVRQFNQNFGLSQAATTGTYNGAPTLAALKQQADIAAQKSLTAQNDASLTGTYQGQATLAALKQQADIASQQLQNAMTAAGLTGTLNGAPTLQAQKQLYDQQLGIINAAQTAQANPFLQQQLYGQANRIFSGQAVPGFQAPGTVAGVGTAGGNTAGGMGYLSQMIDDIRSPQANQTTADSFLAQTPTPNKIDSQSFLRSNPSTQNVILQAMQQKYGVDPTDAMQQIKNTLPQFTAPSTTGVVRRG